MSSKDNLLNSAAASAIALPEDAIGEPEMEFMREVRAKILAQFENRLNNPMMGLSQEQKASMRIELYLGAGFALGEAGSPLGAIFLKEASVMSENYYLAMRAAGNVPEQ